ncbi:hypothetical protein KC19_4G047500, partial [Ceratodon purpureus]
QTPRSTPTNQPTNQTNHHTTKSLLNQTSHSLLACATSPPSHPPVLRPSTTPPLLAIRPLTLHISLIPTKRQPPLPPWSLTGLHPYRLNWPSHTTPRTKPELSGPQGQKEEQVRERARRRWRKSSRLRTEAGRHKVFEVEASVAMAMLTHHAISTDAHGLHWMITLDDSIPRMMIAWMWMTRTT